MGVFCAQPALDRLRRRNKDLFCVEIDGFKKAMQRKLLIALAPEPREFVANLNQKYQDLTNVRKNNTIFAKRLSNKYMRAAFSRIWQAVPWIFVSNKT